MSDTFDPYHKWLGIPPAEQPPDHYRLLGLARFESDLEVISSAADQRMAFVQSKAGGDHIEDSQRLLNDLAKARVCLLDPDKRAKYEQKIRGVLPPSPKVPSEKLPSPRLPAKKRTSQEQRVPKGNRWRIPAILAVIASVSLIVSVIVWLNWERSTFVVEQNPHADLDSPESEVDATTAPVPKAVGSRAANSEIDIASSLSSPAEVSPDSPEPDVVAMPPMDDGFEASTSDVDPTSSLLPEMAGLPDPSESEVVAAAISKTPMEVPAQPNLPPDLGPGNPADPADSFMGTKAGNEREITLPGGVQLKQIWCPPGTFTIGTPGATKTEAPVEVTLSSGFWLAQTETTQAQFTAITGTTHGDTDYYKARANFPASYINHAEAEAYCVKLTEIERKADRLPTGWKYALPTEAQWEYACRAGTTTAYSFGDDDTQLGDYAWFHKNARDIDEKYAHTVATKQPNPWGLSDMHGNLWEWCRDAYGEKLLGGRNPVGPSTGSYRVYRGGSWNDSARRCRSAYRRWCDPSIQLGYLGFRVAAVPVEPAVPAEPVVPTSPTPQVITSKSTGMTLQSIPVGEFLMGSSDADVAAYLKADPNNKEEYMKQERPQHTVRITRAFYMGTHEVTQGEFQKVMGRNPSYFAATGSKDMNKYRVAGMNTTRFPVEKVTWYDGVEFCNKLSTADGLTPYYTLSGIERGDDGSITSATVAHASGSSGYRLPTEAEWEYAARAKTTTAFHFGNVLNGDKANVDGNKPFGTTTKGTYLKRTTAVGSYPENAFGLRDMCGNVSEWCDDGFEWDAYAARTGVTSDPIGIASYNARLLRGGSWNGGALGTRSASRNWNSQGSRRHYSGFRVSRTP